MKKILCDDTTCIHNEDVKINGAPVLVCKRCDTMIINTYRDSCRGYEKIEDYFKRINYE